MTAQTEAPTTPPTPPEAAGIRIRDLHVEVGGRALLENTNAEFPAGKVTLLVGASGSGKTVLMKILAGLIERDEPPFRIRGSIETDGRVGIVFQNFALFDELSCTENVEFAADHRRHTKGDSKDRPDLEPKALLEEFGVPSTTPVRNLSGGQQQRLAVARTLAYDPPVIVYDEPTSGLDPANAAIVAERIRETCVKHQKTTVVVTHDYASLRSVADGVWVLDPEKRELREVDLDDFDTLTRNLPGARGYEERRDESRPSFLSRAVSEVLGFFETTGTALDRGGAAVLGLIPRFPSLGWGVRYFAHYFSLIASLSSWIYFAAAGVIAGFVATYFSFEFLPHRNYSEPLLGDELLNAVGFALYRIIVPVLVTVLLAARCGAAVASDVGNRTYGHQLDALRSLGVTPERYLLSNILFAFLVATPLLVGVGFLTARLTSLVVFSMHHADLETTTFWARHFDRDVLAPGVFFPAGTEWVLLKSLLCGASVGAIAYFQGARPKNSGPDVSRSITTTVIYATLLVLAIHCSISLAEFEVSGS